MGLYSVKSQSVVHNEITTIQNNFYFIFFNRSSIPDPQSSIPSFPVNLKVLLIN